VSFTPGQPEQDDYTPLNSDQAKAFNDALNNYQAQQRPWWQRIAMLPCFIVDAGAQIMQRRCNEWKSKG
jgi:hypothetical protein